MSYTPETAISAVDWPNGWGVGAKGINAACTQLGVKTLHELDELMADPERQKKFKTALGDRQAPFMFTFNLADKVCNRPTGARKFNDSHVEFDRRAAEEARPTPEFPKAPAPRPTDTEDPDDSPKAATEHVMPRTGHHIREATLEDMDTALQDMLKGLTNGEIDRKREWGNNRVSRWRHKHKAFKKASDAAREAYQKSLRSSAQGSSGKTVTLTGVKPPLDDVAAPNKTPAKTDTPAQDVVDNVRGGDSDFPPSEAEIGEFKEALAVFDGFEDEGEKFPPFPEPTFENEDDLPAIEDGPADPTTFCRSCGGGVNENGNRVHSPACPKRPTDKLPDREADKSWGRQCLDGTLLNIRRWSEPTMQVIPRNLPHPFIEGLVQHLPKPGSEWPEDDRQRWLCCAEQIFELMYRRPAEAPTAE